MNETNHPSSLATCTLIQDFLGVKDGGIYEAVVQLKQRLDAVVAGNEKLIEAMRAIYTDGLLLTTATGSGDDIYLWDYICDPKEQIEQWIAEAKTTSAALAEVEAKAALPANWDDLLFNEMNRRFELKRHDDAYLTNGDTQIGVEFAIEFIKQLREAR